MITREKNVEEKWKSETYSAKSELALQQKYLKMKDEQISRLELQI